MALLEASLQHLIRNLIAWISGKPAMTQARREKHALVLAAIEQVVEGTDPRIRLVSRYQKKLRRSVKRSLGYIDELVAGIPKAIELNGKTWSTDPVVNAFFTTADDMRRVFSLCSEIRQFFDQKGLVECYAGLAMTRREKQVFGMKLSGDVIQREVPQTTVSFVGHRVGLPAATESETREGLKRLALNFLIGQALERILALRTQRETLERQKQFLLIKLKMLQSKHSGLESLSQEAQQIESELGSLRQKLAENKEDLEEVRIQLNDLDDYIDLLNEVLGHPENHLTVHQISMKLNRLGVKLDQNSTELGSDITVAEVIGGSHLNRVVALVRYPRGDLLSREEMYARVSRYLTTI